jgi:hypothetical protein
MENVGMGGVVPVTRNVVADHGWLWLGLGAEGVEMVVVWWSGACGACVCCGRGCV